MINALVKLPLQDCFCDLTPYFSSEDTIGDLKKLIAAQTGTRHDKIVLKKW